MYNVALLLLSAATSFALLFTPAPQSLGSSLPQTPAVFQTSLASPITSSASSLTLSDNSIRGGGSVSGYNCFTVDEGSAQAETICGTVASTAVTSLERGVSQANGTTTVAALQFAHRRGASVKITDFPIVQRVKAMLNGEDTIPTLIRYTDTVLIGGASATSTVATKFYVDSVVSAGAADSSLTTKGLVEKASGAEAAAGNADGTGNTSAPLALTSAIATSTCQSVANSVLISLLSTGKLSSNCVDVTATYAWSGNTTWSGLINSFAQGSKLGIGTTTPYAALSVFGEIVSSQFNATSTSATSTVAGNLRVANNATTTNLTVSGSCAGCPTSYTASSTTFSLSSSNFTYTGSVPASANIGIGSYTIDSGDTHKGGFTITRLGLNTVNVNHDESGSADNCDYELSIPVNTNNFRVSEDTDGSGNCSITGTIYWYK